MEKEIFIFFGVLIAVGALIIWLSNYRFLKQEKKDRAAAQRRSDCKHIGGFTVLKVFGHPDIRECRDCGRVFETSGEEISRRYLERLLEDTEEWLENSDGGRELKVYLSREQFRKLYRISMERKMPMDDMIGELIDKYRNE